MCECENIKNDGDIGLNNRPRKSMKNTLLYPRHIVLVITFSCGYNSHKSD